MQTNNNNEAEQDLLGLAWALTQPDEFRYQLLSRMQSDCEYYLGYGQIYGNHLWMGNDNVEEQIEAMKSLWHSFSDKPEWLSLEQIEAYKTKISL